MPRIEKAKEFKLFGKAPLTVMLWLVKDIVQFICDGLENP